MPDTICDLTGKVDRKAKKPWTAGEMLNKMNKGNRRM
jgi:predicted house-cleaning NTP pyrophosphatase (Maf/HAM1 superfamily)